MENSNKGIENKTTTNNAGVITFDISKINTATKCVNAISDLLDKSALTGFYIGVYGAYMNGVEIPAYYTKKGDYVTACKLASTMSLKEASKLPALKHKDYTTLSRYVGAVKLVIEAGDFGYFASGKLSFTYDKIYLYYNNKSAMESNQINSILDAFEISVASLKKLVKEYNAPADSDSDSAPADDSTSDSAPVTAVDSANNDEMVEFVFNGKKYNAPKSAVLALVAVAVEITE